MELTSELKQGNDGTVTITAELASKDLESFRKEALKKLSSLVDIKGFRKGNIPDDVLVKHTGEAAILEEMAHFAINTAYIELIKKHDIRAIGRPEISVTKLAPGNPLGFTIITSVMPTVELPDYKKIAEKAMKEKEDLEVTDKEIDDAIKQLMHMRAEHAPCDHDHAEGEICNHEDKKDAPLPEIDDAFVQSLGKFKNVAEFKDKLRENMTEEKKHHAGEQKRIKTLEHIMDKTKITIPQVLVDYELEKMMHQMEHDIAMSGMKFDEYLGKIEKTKDKLREDWKDTATKRAKMHLVVNAIADQEKIEPSDADIETETKKVMEQYKDAKDISEQSVRLYVAGILTNQKVFEFLEEQK